jgi:FAD/FMN-containing dehydrogenase
MGGYLKGGGHSPLPSKYGLAADQVLSLEAVTADGRFVTASEDCNPNLFWALRGGGGGTFGVITSVVVRVYPKITVSTMIFNYSNETIGSDKFFQGVAAYWAEFPKYTTANTSSYWFIERPASGGLLFRVDPFFAPGLTIAELQQLVAPFLAKLAGLGILVAPDFS